MAIRERRKIIRTSMRMRIRIRLEVTTTTATMTRVKEEEEEGRREKQQAPPTQTKIKQSLTKDSPRILVRRGAQEFRIGQVTAETR